MKNLYAPWRYSYILKEKTKGCILCKKYKANLDEQNLIVKRGKLAYILMNLYPYNNGHLMIAPYRHIAKLSSLDDDELFELMKLAQLSEKVLEKVYHPDGFNMGINIGKVAGAGINDHLHLHIVPRWDGDTNFLAAIGETKVIPESIEDAYKKLKNAFEKEKE
jgi:ATP adenylyltransferase